MASSRTGTLVYLTEPERVEQREYEVQSPEPGAILTEALALANDVEYGLASGVWTEDMRRAQRMAEGIEAGTVWINEYRMVAPESPFGGYKDSGLDRENGREGLEEYYQTKSVWIDQTGEVGDPFALDTG